MNIKMIKIRYKKSCKEKKIIRQIWENKNRKRINNSSILWRLLNKDKHDEIRKRYIEKNPDKEKDNKSNYYQKNKYIFSLQKKYKRKWGFSIPLNLLRKIENKLEEIQK